MNNNDNIISNPQTEVPASSAMNAKDYLADILEMEKNLVNNYSTALNESSNDHLYKVLFRLFKETSDMQRNLFNLTFRKGWYSLEKAEANKIEQKHSEYASKETELSE